MKRFRFFSEAIIEAETEDEAIEKFADNSLDFTGNAEHEEIEEIEEIEEVEEELTHEQAKEYCRIKWTHASETGCDEMELDSWLGENHPEIHKLSSGCAYCELYSDTGIGCPRCPLAKKWGHNCVADYKVSVWSQWSNSNNIDERKDLATQILNDL